MDKKPGIRVYGPHLMLDCYGANLEKLGDVGFIFKFLDELPALINMKKIGPPQMAQLQEEDNVGVSGIIMITTSHISIHTYSNKGCFFMDVFSCAPFDEEFLTEHVRQAFEVEKIDKVLIERGQYFPIQELYKVKEE